MSQRNISLRVPAALAEHLQGDKLHGAFEELCRLADLGMQVEEAQCPEPAPGESALSIEYRGACHGRVVVPNDADDVATRQVGPALARIAEHFIEREMAVQDLASALMDNYEELNLLYNLLPHVSTKVDPAEIGQFLVAETARVLNCRRVSMLVLDDRKAHFKVLAARGLPDDVMQMTIPIKNSVAGKAASRGGVVVVNDIDEHPDLLELSRGIYDSAAFIVACVPMQACGEALGMITATERQGGAEFSAHDVKLLEGLSAMGASVLLNCRLHETISRQMISTIHALASAVDAKDAYTHDHAGRVADLCVETAKEMGVTGPEQLREVRLAGLLHDIGKIGIPDAILCKPSSLTSEEFGIMRKHVEIGPRIVEQVAGLEGVANAIRHHHERFDGLGYPAGLSGDVIPLPSALIAVADTFDALTSDRPYRKGTDAETALAELRRCSGTQLNPDVVDALIRVVIREEGLAATDPEHNSIAVTVS
jgi:putative nucleotidyltransferase with HDIG domain